VTPAEILRELEELDTRLERLRIKYDQFFTGTEKTLPFVLRKDVDRRFQALHREPMRNTGARFKCQTLVQRFTSYQTYWNRILRQMEEGTYRRDVIRAQRLGLGTQAVRDAKRQADTEELDASDLEEIEPIEPEPARSAPPAPVTFKDPFEDTVPPAPSRLEVPRLEGVKEPSVAKPLPQRDSLPASVPPQPTTAPPLERPFAPRAASSPTTHNASVPPGTRPSSPTVPSAQSPGVRIPPPPSQHPLRPSATMGSSPRVPAVPPAAPTGSSPRVPAVPPAAPTGSSPRVPALRSAAPIPTPERPAPPNSAPARPPALSNDDAALRNLYERYVAARRQTGEPGEVRYETVAKQVRETLPRLAEKYQGADVRLDVAIKDGKAILRPVVTVKK